MRVSFRSRASLLAIGLFTLLLQGYLSIMLSLSLSCLLHRQAMPTIFFSSKSTLFKFKFTSRRYKFTVDPFSLISYPLSIVNVFVSGGLIYIYLNKSKFPNWSPGIRATLPVTAFFLLSNLYLVAAPYIPPDAGQNVYESLPYYLHCVVALGLFAAGAVYYLVWAVLLPRWGGYVLVKESVVDADGWSRSLFTRLPKASAVPS